MGVRSKSETMDFRALQIEAGFIDIYDSAWDDLRFPAQAINPAGLVAAPGVDTNTGLLLFDNATPEAIAGVAQMPHSWKEGTTISPHVHWQKTTSASGNVLWKLEYEVVNNGDVALMTYATPLTAATTVAGTTDTNTANKVLISSFGDIDMTGFRVSCLIFWKVTRVANDDADTYGADARLLEFDIHYMVDTFGSQDEFTKYGRE